MQKLLFKFLFICFLGLVSASPCFADVILTYPINYVAVSSESVTFQWYNTDISQKYCYAVELGPYVESDNSWYPGIGGEMVYGNEYTYEPPQSYIGKLKWWVRYGIDDGTKCEKNLSSNISGFIFKPEIPSNTEVKGEAVKGSSPVIPKMEIKEEPIVVKKAQTQSKPFVFPLVNITGVTQWHGDTTYQKPHKGIDFGAKKETIVAVSKGIVVAKGWDSTKGDCFSGGNYLIVQQKNGMYAAYFHLNSSNVDVGQKVKTGQTIGISGNTGTWNCQPLAYHLHFEVRKNRNQSSHVNPVEYINVDWGKVLTLNYKQNPGRLSGDNPHPGI